MKCEVCEADMAQGETLYRVNELGVKGIWRCYEHLTPEQKLAVDPEVKNIVDAIENKETHDDPDFPTLDKADIDEMIKGESE